MLLLFPKLQTLIAQENYAPGRIQNLSEERIRSWLPFHAMIVDNYKTLRTLLANKETGRKRELYLSALFLAELLERMAWPYGNRWRDLPDLVRQQEKYRQALCDSGYNIPLLAPRKWRNIPSSLQENIYEYHAVLNFGRLCIVRGKKVLSTVAVLTSKIKEYQNFINVLESFGPLLNYLSWMAFLPRLWANFDALFKCLVPGLWMHEDEKALGWQQRVSAHFAVHWFEWANDLPWCIAGILGCFLLTGSLSAVGIYLTVALFAYDIILAGIRAAMALLDLYALREQYATSLLEQEFDPGMAEIHAAYVKSIDQHIHHQQLHAALNMFNTIALFGAISLTIPALALLNPAIPLIAATLILAITLGVYVLGHCLKKYAPLQEALPESRAERKGSALETWGMFGGRDSVDIHDPALDFSGRVLFERT